MKTLASILLGLASAVSHAEPVSVLFVGNSYTFGRNDPVMSYNMPRRSLLPRLEAA